MRGYIEDKEFGKVYVELRRGMTSVRFSYHADGNLLMRAPLGASAADLQRMININREQLLNHWEGDTLHLQVHESADLDDNGIKRTISSVIGRAMEVMARAVLLPYAQQIADELGLMPAGLEVGRGMRKLGHCTRGRVIQLSRNLMFMPEPLIRYIICHELAHLTHMNHSPQFHALVNQYCSGQEKQLERQLRQFRFPILK